MVKTIKNHRFRLRFSQLNQSNERFVVILGAYATEIWMHGIAFEEQNAGNHGCHMLKNSTIIEDQYFNHVDNKISLETPATSFQTESPMATNGANPTVTRDWQA